MCGGFVANNLVVDRAMAKDYEVMMKEVHETLASAEEALLRADAVRLAALHAVEKAREAVILQAAGVAAELLLHAAEIAATAVKAAEVKAMEAWEATAARSIERTMAANKERSGRDRRG
jgi:hypothetical protein